MKTGHSTQNPSMSEMAILQHQSVSEAVVELAGHRSYSRAATFRETDLTGCYPLARNAASFAPRSPSGKLSFVDWKEARQVYTEVGLPLKIGVRSDLAHT